MRQTLFALSLGFVGVILATQNAYGQSNPQCGQRAQVLDSLANKYGESRRSVGLANNNAMMEVFASEESRSWTITVTLANGMTCLVASGVNYETVVEPLPAKGRPA